MSRAKKIEMLSDTDFWNTRGKDLMRSRIDPRRTSVESALKVQVLCEGCGKQIQKRLNLWARGKTRCRACQNEHNQRDMPKAEARKPEAFGASTLWGDFPWKVILSWDWSRNDKAPWELRSQSKSVIHLVCPKCGCQYETTARSCHRSWAGARKGAHSCPCCGLKVLMVGSNDLGTLYPEVAAHWHPTKNGNLTPQDVMPNSRKKVWWLYDDGSEGQATIRNKTARGFAKRGSEHGGHATNLPLNVTHPELCEQWDDEANQDLSPDMLTYGSKRYVGWRCPDCGYAWRAQIKSRTISESGCPKCAKKGKSSGEDKTEQVLERLGLAYAVNRRFPDCRYKAPLPFDFAVYDAAGCLRFVIEYQGRQHFFVVPMWGGESGLAYRQKCDQIKRDYCKAKGIPELEIPYTVDTVEGIQGEVMQFILRQMPVPVGDVAASSVAC